MEAADRAGAACTAGAGEPDHRPALCRAQTCSRARRSVRFPNRTDYPQIPSVPSLQTGVQRSLSDLIANRPKLLKGIDQMLELLNSMTADGGAQDMAKGVRSMAQLADLLADPKGPVVETLGQLPALMARGSSHDRRGARVGAAGQIWRWLRSSGLVGGARGAGDEDPRRPAGDTGGSPASSAEQLTTILAQTGPRSSASRRAGCPNCRG